MRSRLAALGLCVLGGGSVLVTNTPGGTKTIGVVVLAAVGAILATKGWVRRAVAAVTVALGLLMLTGGTAMAIAAGLLIVAGGVIAFVKAPGWPTMGARYERKQDTDMWSAIDRGEDPTARN